MKAITYSGPLAGGYVVDPTSRKEYPFEKGREIFLHDAFAEQLAGQEDSPFKNIREVTAEEVEAAEELERQEITQQEGELN